jgi:DNA-binding CsgD family transcriptional regulator
MSDREVEDISLECRFRDVDAVARKLGFDRFALAGIEGGGNLAAAYAAAHPDSVSHLVLINWTPRFGDEASGARLRALGVLLNRDWEMLAENIGGVAFGYDNPLAAGYGRLVRASVSQAMAKRYGAELAREDMFSLLADIATDTLVLHSEKNGFSSEASARAAASRIPNARLVTFEGSLPDHIQKLVQTVGDFIAPAAAQPAAPVGAATSPGAEPSPLTGLTVREIEILTLLARGLSNREIADRLTLSHRTIERHLENIYRKTGARNRAEATALAFTHRLLDR